MGAAASSSAGLFDLDAPGLYAASDSQVTAMAPFGEAVGCVRHALALSNPFPLDVTHPADDFLLVGAGHDVSVRDLAVGCQLWSMCHHDADVTALVVMDGDGEFVTADDDAVMLLWDAHTLAPKLRFDDGHGCVCHAAHAAAGSVAAGARRSRRIALAGSASTPW